MVPRHALVLPLAVLVFLGSFIPLVGAVLFGGLSVVVTLVTVGPVPAVVLLAVLVVENQVEAHLLQPFVVGRAVRLHPVAIVIVLAAGGALRCRTSRGETAVPDGDGRDEAHTGEMALPPGSRLPPVAQTALAVQDPVGFFSLNRERFGPVFRARFVGVPGIAYVATPALAEVVLRTDRDVGQAGTARKDFLEPLVGAESVLCLEGGPWMRERRRLAPAFHGHRLALWTDTIADIVEAEVSTWPMGEPFALRPRMQRITLEVIFNVVFGSARGARHAERGRPVTHDAAGRLRALLPELLDVASSPALAFVPPWLAVWLQQSPMARRLPRNTVAGFYGTKSAVDRLLLAEITRERRDGAPGEGGVLGMLAAVPDATETQIRDELVTILEAGHETTATGLAWLFEQLVRLPEVLATVRDAVDRDDEAYLNAVVKESLRRRPVVVDAPRVLTGPLRLEGFEVPSGWYVAPVIPLVHRDLAAYPDAERFRPERFLEGEVPPGAWIPFGGSRRLCLGIQLALLEMRVVLVEVLRRVELTAVGGASERARLRGVTIVPEHGARVVAHPRRGAQ